MIKVNADKVSHGETRYAVEPGEIYYHAGYYAVVKNFCEHGECTYRLLNLETFEVFDFPPGDKETFRNMLYSYNIKPNPNTEIKEIVLGDKG